MNMLFLVKFSIYLNKKHNKIELKIGLVPFLDKGLSIISTIINTLQSLAFY